MTTLDGIEKWEGRKEGSALESIGGGLPLSLSSPSKRFDFIIVTRPSFLGAVVMQKSPFEIILADRALRFVQLDFQKSASDMH